MPLLGSTHNMTAVAIGMFARALTRLSKPLTAKVRPELAIQAMFAPATVVSACKSRSVKPSLNSEEYEPELIAPMNRVGLAVCFSTTCLD
jgi:hypothetical protein